MKNTVAHIFPLSTQLGTALKEETFWSLLIAWIPTELTGQTEAILRIKGCAINNYIRTKGEVSGKGRFMLIINIVLVKSFETKKGGMKAQKSSPSFTGCLQHARHWLYLVIGIKKVGN